MNQSKRILLERTSLFRTIGSESFVNALKIDFDNLSEKPGDADIFFSMIPGNISTEDFLPYILAYEEILNILFKHDSKKYKRIHKGTAFYLLALQSFILRDFERAVFYMDAALHEDLRFYKTLSNTPSRLFFALDTSNPNQLALNIVKRIRELIQSMLVNVQNCGCSKLTIDDIVLRLINDKIPELRTIATTYLSFILEYEARRNQILISSEGIGTGEPFLLHLIKGAIIFESLLANSEIGKKITKRDLDAYLKDSGIISNLDLNNKPKSFDSTSYEKLIRKVLAIKEEKSKYSHQCVRVTWGIRNLLTHSIGWPKPSIKEYDILFNYIFGAICLALHGLYSKDTE